MSKKEKSFLEKIFEENDKFDNEMETFIKQIKFDDKEQIEDLKGRIKNKSLYIYMNIYNFMKKNDIHCSFKNLSSIHVYDKRIRKVIYKYTSLIEEFYRSQLFNKFKISDKDKKRILNLNLSKLIILCKTNKLINDESSKQLEKIRKLRNIISHNKLLLISYDNTINDENITLIKELYNFLKIDNKFSESFLDDIKSEETKKMNRKKYGMKFKFQIPELLKISNKLKI